VLAVGRDVGEDRLATTVAESIVVAVDAEIRSGDGLAGDEPPEPPLDKVIEQGVEVAGHRRGCRTRQRRFLRFRG
jgi:hypothetical protein